MFDVERWTESFPQTGWLPPAGTMLADAGFPVKPSRVAPMRSDGTVPVHLLSLERTR